MCIHALSLSRQLLSPLTSTGSLVCYCNNSIHHSNTNIDNIYRQTDRQTDRQRTQTWTQKIYFTRIIVWVQSKYLFKNKSLLSYRWANVKLQGIIYIQYIQAWMSEWNFIHENFCVKGGEREGGEREGERERERERETETERVTVTERHRERDWNTDRHSLYPPPPPKSMLRKKANTNNNSWGASLTHCRFPTCSTPCTSGM